MKFLPLREFDDVTSALNFDTPDCHVIGGCDLYTTKAAGSDKKLYKNIEHSLESQYEQLLVLSATLSAPHASSVAKSLNLSRSSPFGPLSQISSRRTFAYLIATLNASHPDYDFSHLLRPTDFRRERSLKTVMNTVDTTLYNLRPKNANMTLAAPSASSSVTVASPPAGPGGSQVWGPQMWTLIDKEMSLRECSIYCYVPEEDPYDGDEGAIWSLNYFFFNKARKRVCYVYLRGLSIMSHSPQRPGLARIQAAGRRSASRSSGAEKRARYWLGDRVDMQEVHSATDDEDDEEETLSSWGDDEVDVEGDILDDGDEILRDASIDDEDEDQFNERSRSAIRGISEDIAESMEV
ncbi:MAG: RNA polymerase III-inhibiting protein maf1 [Caeruleum heppii]|nr:MAG: RNA polymerase III-inhibiting protein maf1 [Caeruleum heppii]